MKMRVIRLRPRPGARASALIVTLVMVVLMTILLIGFVTSMRFDVASAHAHLQRVCAGVYAQSGVDMAVARLNAATSGTNRFWATQPGRLVVSGSGSNSPVDTVVDLSSGLASTPDEGVDLNPATLADSSQNLIVPSALFSSGSGQMLVRWIYVHKDGSFDTATPPQYSATNPVTGRFAFWGDDESTKLNVNTAWTHGDRNTDSLGHPSHVSLEYDDALLTGTDADTLRQSGTTQLFNSPLDMLRVSGTDLRTTLRENRYALTHYNHSPDLNMFGERRMMLTTQKSLAGDAPFLDILKPGTTDPGLKANINFSNYNNVVTAVYQKLARSDWPFYPGHSFLDKYAIAGTMTEDGLYQLAFDIVEYVRSKESGQPFVVPIRANQITSSKRFDGITGTGDYFIGNTRHPLITEVAYWATQKPSDATKGGQALKIEVYLPPGSSDVDMTTLWGLYSIRRKGDTTNPQAKVGPIKPGPPPGVPDAIGSSQITFYLDGPDTILKAGTYRTLVTYQKQGFSVSSAYPTMGVELRVALTMPAIGGDVVEVAPLQTNKPEILPTVLANASDAPVSGPPDFSAIVSACVADPFVNKMGGDWVTSSASTFGAPNNVSVSPVSSGPEQDTDGLGGLFKAGANMPAASGSTGNIHGIVESVAELGSIPTGIVCSSTTAATVGVPFRTVHLQPQKTGATDLPDWAMLDLFSVPIITGTLQNSAPVPDVLSQRAAVRPNASGTDSSITSSLSQGGLVNINRRIYPFVDGSGNPTLTNPKPLEAMLVGAHLDATATNRVTSAQAKTIAQAIVDHTLATTGTSYGTGPAASIYWTPGQLAEIQGVADKGEASEALLKDIVNLATTRGNVFSIYSVGQSITQLASGKIIVSGERRFQTMVERWIDGTGITGTVIPTTAVSYRTRFSRDVSH